MQKRTRELEDGGVTGVFAAAHLRSLHRKLFRGIFPWAGDFRGVDIFKGEHGFAHHSLIAECLEETLKKLKREAYLTALSAAAFAQRAALYLGEINAIHPFREGNGRTQRKFVRRLALHAGHTLFWIGFTQAEMVGASILSHTRGDNAALAGILARALEAAQ